MKKNIVQSLLFLLFPLFLFSQQTKFSVYLIGDAGEDTVSGKALLLLKEQLLENPSSAVVFLGDNVYPSGFNPNSHNDKLRLESQLNILKDYRGQAYFIPGNHDWDEQRKGGFKKIREQEKYVNEFLGRESAVSNRQSGVFFPGGGLPGPATVMLDEKLRLIMIDTQWFLQVYKKGKKGSKRKTKELFYHQLDSLLAYSATQEQKVIVTAHHPMFTNGAHSRKLQPERFLINYTPFRIFGLFGLDRLFSQDLPQSRYKRMRRRMLECFSHYDNIVYASGHDHNMQFFKEGKNHYIVSGNGSKLSHLRKKGAFTSFFNEDSKTGFVKLEFYPDGRLVTSVYRVGEEMKELKDY